MNTEQLSTENQRLKEEKATALKRISTLEYQLSLALQKIKQLLAAQFAATSERFNPADNSQLALDFDFGELAPTDVEPQEDPADEKVQVTYERAKRKLHPGRHPLPEHLEVEEVRIEPTEDITDAQHIADTIVDTLEFIPGHFIIKRHILPRYLKTEVDENGEAQSIFIQAKMPDRPLPKSIAESGLLTHLITQKFLYHLPFYRQIKQFKEVHEVTLYKSTINDWFASVCTLLKPLYDRLKQKILASDYLQADESPLKVLDSNKKNKAHQGYQWLYHAPVEGLVLFDYRKGRGQNGPKEILVEWSGTLQTDGYAVYDKIVKNRPEITLMGCAAHARRYFFQAKDNDPAAATALAYFARVYAVERHLREQLSTASPAEKVAYRQQHAAPVWEAFFIWAKEQYAQVLPKSAFGKALYYLLHREEKLTVYLKAAQLQIDNNLVENSVRPLALGRKNYLFAGSHAAAQRIAMMYSFFGSCQKQGINPVEWFQYVLDNIADYPINRIEELLPNANPGIGKKK